MQNNTQKLEKGRKVVKFIGIICLIAAIGCYFTGEMVQATNEDTPDKIKNGNKVTKDLYIAATAFGWFGFIMLLTSGSINIHQIMKNLKPTGK